MDDVRSVTSDELRDRIDAAIARRLDATSARDRAHAGHDLLLVLGELERRGCAPDRTHRPTGDGVTGVRFGGMS